METSGIKFSRAIVVGASRGIGSAVAVALARQGVATALVGRNQALLNSVARDCEAAGSPACATGITILPQRSPYRQ